MSMADHSILSQAQDQEKRDVQHMASAEHEPGSLHFSQRAPKMCISLYVPHMLPAA